MFVLLCSFLLTSVYAMKSNTGVNINNNNGNGIDVIEEQFAAWMDRYSKVYSDDEEKEYRRSVWMQTDAQIREHNNNNGKDTEEAAQPSFTMGHNQYSDMTFEEFSAQVLMNRFTSGGQNCSATIEESSSFGRDIEFASIPKKVDWRKMGAVSHVKNQGHCGSCWTFSASGCLESHHYLATSNMVLLSEQQLVDCAGTLHAHTYIVTFAMLTCVFVSNSSSHEKEEILPTTCTDRAMH